MREKDDINRNRKQILGRPTLDFEEHLDGPVPKISQDCQLLIVLYMSAETLFPQDTQFNL